MFKIVYISLDKASGFVSFRPFVSQRMDYWHLETQPVVWGADSHSAFSKDTEKIFFTDMTMRY